MHAFLNDVQNMIISDLESKFFVTSDDKEFKMILVNGLYDFAAKHNKIIHVMVTDPDSIPNHHSGAYDVYELFSIMRCKKIIQGIKYSTYSMLSALTSQTTLYNYHYDEPEWLLHIWKPCLYVVHYDKNGHHSLFDHTIDPNQIETTLANWPKLEL